MGLKLRIRADIVLHSSSPPGGIEVEDYRTASGGFPGHLLWDSLSGVKNATREKECSESCLGGVNIRYSQRAILFRVKLSKEEEDKHLSVKGVARTGLGRG